MARSFVLLLAVFHLLCGPATAADGNPFAPGNVSARDEQALSLQQPLLTKIALYQQHLKQRMADLVRQTRTGEGMRPLLAVLLIAFGYGMVHAAGPGHGKAVAMSFIASRNTSVSSGLLLGVMISFFHGSSGILCILGLHYVLKTSVAGSLASLSYVTQIVSYGLITLLGCAILAKNGWALLSSPGLESLSRKRVGHDEPSRKGLVQWAAAVGLVPCPGVMMVMLFCLSMGAPGLGIALSVCICLGMAATISAVVVPVILGRSTVVGAISRERSGAIQIVVGILSGLLVSLLGILFLLTTLHQAL